MRKNSFFISVLLVAACAACVSCITEVKPFLKPKVVPIAQRIADQEKWLDQDIAAKAITVGNAIPVRAKLAQIKKKYDLLRSIGTLTPEESKSINQMLDKTSEQIFRLGAKRHGVH